MHRHEQRWEANWPLLPAMSLFGCVPVPDRHPRLVCLQAGLRDQDATKGPPYAVGDFAESTRKGIAPTRAAVGSLLASIAGHVSFWFGPRGAGIRRLTGRQETQGNSYYKERQIRHTGQSGHGCAFWFGPRGAGIRRLTGRQEIQGNQY